MEHKAGDLVTKGGLYGVIVSPDKFRTVYLVKCASMGISGYAFYECVKGTHVSVY